MLKQWGKPDIVGQENTDFFGYSGCNFYFWENEQVGAIRVYQKYIYESLEEVKKTLGTPESEGLSEENGQYYLLYRKSDFDIFFNSSKTDGSISDILFKQNN
jgi:hypothetical protein